MLTISTKEFEQYTPIKKPIKKRTLKQRIIDFYEEYELEFAWACFGFVLALTAAAVAFVIYLISIVI